MNDNIDILRTWIVIIIIIIFVSIYISKNIDLILKMLYIEEMCQNKFKKLKTYKSKSYEIIDKIMKVWWWLINMNGFEKMLKLFLSRGVFYLFWKVGQRSKQDNVGESIHKSKVHIIQ